MSKTNSFTVATDVRLVQDAEGRKAGEKDLVTFTYADNPGNDKDEAMFVRVTVAGKLAELYSGLKKGDRVNVVGKMTYNKYEKKDGTSGIGFKIDYPMSVTRVFVDSAPVEAPPARTPAEAETGVIKKGPGRPKKEVPPPPWQDD